MVAFERSDSLWHSGVRSLHDPCLHTFKEWHSLQILTGPFFFLYSIKTICVCLDIELITSLILQGTNCLCLGQKDPICPLVSCFILYLHSMVTVIHLCIYIPVYINAGTKTETNGLKQFHSSAKHKTTGSVVFRSSHWVNRQCTHTHTLIMKQQCLINWCALLFSCFMLMLQCLPPFLHIFLVRGNPAKPLSWHHHHFRCPPSSYGSVILAGRWSQVCFFCVICFSKN